MRSELVPGCKAIIVGAFIPENNGIMVTCIKHIGALDDWFEKDLWEIDVFLSSKISSTPNTLEGSVCAPPASICPGGKMQRIDDHPEKETLLEIIDLEANK
jgi:hypothetical protein